jgi:hypothetical protein
MLPGAIAPRQAITLAPSGRATPSATDESRSALGWWPERARTRVIQSRERGRVLGAEADDCVSWWLLHKAVSEKLVGDREDGPQRGWL